MKLTVASVSTKTGKGRKSAIEALVADYIERSTHYQPTEAKVFASESDLLATLARTAGRVPARLILLDSTGQLLTSIQVAAHLERLRDAGTQHLVLAIGPADGWSEIARKRADLELAFGRITLPHELARLVLAEQVYRALTILAGHPYHSGH